MVVQWAGIDFGGKLSTGYNNILIKSIRIEKVVSIANYLAYTASYCVEIV